MGLVLRLCRREKRRGLAAFSLTASGRGEFLISPFQSLRRQAFREAPGLSACTACSAAPKPGSRRPETAALTAASRHGKISVSTPLRPALEVKSCLRAASAGASGDFCYMEENTGPSCCVFCLPSAKRLLYRGTFMRRRFSPVLPLVSSAARPLSALTVNF